MSTSSIEDKTGTPPGGGQTASVSAPQGSGGPEDQPLDSKAAVKKAYSEATTALRLAHRDEFNADVKARAKALGHDWSPRPTAEEKAKAKVDELLAQYPGLIDATEGS